MRLTNIFILATDVHWNLRVLNTCLCRWGPTEHIWKV